MSDSVTDRKIILVQPSMGVAGEFVRHPPLSLLYVASGLVKEGFDVRIIDLRASTGGVAEVVKSLDADVLWVGLTVMGGAPVASALEVSRAVKTAGKYPVVWGGSLATIAPGTVLGNSAVDYAISGSGVSSAIRLSRALVAKDTPTSDELDHIPGLYSRHEGRIVGRKPFRGFEPVPFREIPYHLISDYGVYAHFGTSRRVFPIYSAFGCPYRCAFCISPAMYKEYKPKWLPLPATEVVDHIEYLRDRYDAGLIYFYDDDSFVNPEHIRGILDELKRRRIKVPMSFRGARVNEILRMDDSFLNALAESGTEILHIGLESGSPRILALYEKGVTVEDTIAANRRLAENGTMIAAYNWIVGTPGETRAEMAATRRLLLQVLDENPRAVIFQPNKFHPLPGTVMAEVAARHGYRPPATLEEWACEEAEGDKSEPWYTPAIRRDIEMMQVMSYFIDRKAELLPTENTLYYKIVRLIIALYRPFARFRFKKGFSSLLFEYPLFQRVVMRHRKG